MPRIGDTPEQAHATVELVYRRDSRRVLATLIRLLGDFDLAEEALHDAFAAAVHTEADDAAATDWAQIVGLYDVLLRADPSPIVELNRAVAVAMRDGPEVGLTLIDGIFDRGDLADYAFAHAARADLCRRLSRTSEARASYRKALDLTRQEPDRRFLRRRLDALD